MIRIRADKRKRSAHRIYLRNAVLEGIPATLVANLLGGPIMTAYLLFLGANPSQVGLVAAIPSLANLFQIAAALFLQKVSNRRLVMTVTGVAHRGIWLLTGLIPFILPKELWVHAYLPTIFLSFLMAAANSVTWSSLVADFVPAQIRGRYFGFRNTLLWAMGSVALLIAGQVLEWFPGRAGFAVLYGLSALCVGWNLYAYLQYPNPPFEKSKEANQWKMMKKPFAEKDFVLAALFVTIFIFLQNLVVPLFSYIMLDILDIRYRTVSIITTVQTIVMMLSYYYWGNLNARFSTRSLLLWVFPIIALSCMVWGAVAFIPSVVVLVISHILLGFGTGGYTLLVFNYTIGDTPKADRPMFIAVFSALTGLSGFVGTAFGGVVYEWADDYPFWLQSYGIPWIAGLLMMGFAAAVGPFIFKKKRLPSL
jgi:MFS family permease